MKKGEISMSILVTAGTGTIGSRVVKRLKNLGLNPVTMTSSKEKAAQIGSEFSRVATFQDEKSLENALVGMEKVVLITPASQSEVEDGIRLVQAAKRQNISHIVLLSIHNLEVGQDIPHFKSKQLIEDEIEKLNIPKTVIKANNFFQNDTWFKEAIMNFGIYPQPFGDKGLSRVDADDIALAIVNALTDESHIGKAYPLVGAESLSGIETAEIYSKVTGKKITYIGNDLDSWQKENEKYLPAWLVADWKKMYQLFQDQGLKASEEDLIAQKKILKKEPSSFTDFVKELVGQWNNQ